MNQNLMCFIFAMFMLLNCLVSKRANKSEKNEALKYVISFNSLATGIMAVLFLMSALFV